MYNKFIDNLFKDMIKYEDDKQKEKEKNDRPVQKEKNAIDYLKKIKPGNKDPEYLFQLDPLLLKNFTADIDMMPWQPHEKKKMKEYPLWYLLTTTPVKSWVRKKQGSLNLIDDYPEFFSSSIKQNDDSEEIRPGKYRNDLVQKLINSIVDYKFCKFVFSDWCEHYNFDFRPHTYAQGSDMLLFGELSKKKSMYKIDKKPTVMVIKGKKKGKHLWEINEDPAILNQADILALIDIDTPNIQNYDFSHFREIDDHITRGIEKIKFNDVCMYFPSKEIVNSKKQHETRVIKTKDNLIKFDPRMKLKL